MILREKDLIKIYEEITKKKLSIEKLKKKYCLNIPDYVYFEINMHMTNGDYYKNGILTQDDYKKVLQRFSNNEELYLGDINGKNSQVYISSKSLHFYDPLSKEINNSQLEEIEKFILEHGKATDYKFFNDSFTGDESSDDDNPYNL